MCWSTDFTHYHAAVHASQRHHVAASGPLQESLASGAFQASKEHQTIAGRRGVLTAAEAQPSPVAVAVPSLLAASLPAKPMKAISLQLTDASTDADPDTHTPEASHASEPQVQPPTLAAPCSLATAVKTQASTTDASHAAPVHTILRSRPVECVHSFKPAPTDADACKTATQNSSNSAAAAAVARRDVQAQRFVHKAAQHAGYHEAAAGSAAPVAVTTRVTAAAVSGKRPAELAQVAAEAHSQPVVVKEPPAGHFKPQEVGIPVLQTSCIVCMHLSIPGKLVITRQQTTVTA